ncbi:YigZ family protein, partial [Arthrospira platensis SPKY1]|nr:YigZ family protein [Arthrospira platensis SPKY1]
MAALPDTYRTLSGPSTGEFRDRGSKFLAYAFPVYTDEEIGLHLEEVRKLHPKARHHCYAYRLGLDGNHFRANDDGEPSGTAGRPILGQIDSFGLCNVLLVVTRYFGGTLLGTSGLINAYKLSAAA